MFGLLRPNPENGRLIAGVVIVSYCILLLATMIKLRGSLPEPWLLHFLKNWGFILYLSPLLFAISSRFVSLHHEMGKDVTLTQNLFLALFRTGYLSLYGLPILALVASVQGSLLSKAS